MALSHFDEKAGSVYSVTDWGSWSQTCTEVNIEVKLPQKCKGKDLKVTITNKNLSCSAFNQLIFEGQLFAFVHADDSMWSLEDGNLIRILLSKTKMSEVWTSLMADGSCAAAPKTLLDMRKQIDLEMFQLENPGMDFSRAKLQKCYETLN